VHGPKEKKKYETKDEGARLNDWPKPGMTSPRRSQTGAGGPRLGVFLFPLSLAGNRIGLADGAGPIRLLVSVSEKSSWSIRQRTNPRSIQLRAEKSFLASASHSGAPPRRSPVLLFLFWTVHGPFSLFLLEEKEKMGGAKDQPSSWLKSPRPLGREILPL
jgi:hypothetical protein